MQPIHFSIFLQSRDRFQKTPAGWNNVESTVDDLNCLLINTFIWRVQESQNGCKMAAVTSLSGKEKHPLKATATALWQVNMLERSPAWARRDYYSQSMCVIKLGIVTHAIWDSFLLVVNLCHRWHKALCSLRPVWSWRSHISDTGELVGNAGPELLLG